MNDSPRVSRIVEIAAGILLAALVGGILVWAYNADWRTEKQRQYDEGVQATEDLQERLKQAIIDEQGYYIEPDDIPPQTE